MSFVPEREYWSERQGRGPTKGGLPLETLKKLVLSTLDELSGRYYFQEAFGYDCVDEGDVPGRVGSDVSAWFLRAIGRDEIWPYRVHADQWDADTLFDVLELLHDVVSKPIHGRYHDFNNCGWHYSHFDASAGRLEYRQALNPLLARYEEPLTMRATGEIVHLTPAEFAPLLAAPVPAGTDADLVTTRIDAAKQIFERRSASLSDRRQAVRELADVLEALRKEIKEEMLAKDEQELFRLANGFAIRHNNREQMRLYDDAIWLRWAFYVYLATIHAVLRIRAREQGVAAEPGDPSPATTV